MKREFEEGGRDVEKAIRRFTHIDWEGKYSHCYWGPMRDYMITHMLEMAHGEPDAQKKAFLVSVLLVWLTRLCG